MHHRIGQPVRIILIANPGSRRTQLLAAAVKRRAGLTMCLVPWADLLTGRADLRQAVRAGDVVRIDSPGRDFAVEQMLLRVGRPDDRRWQNRIDCMPNERGRVWWPDVWYRGLCAALDRITGQLAECPSHRLVSDPAGIRTMFDKTATNRVLVERGVPVPPAIGRIHDSGQLLGAMRDRRWPAVFVKLTYGSSAAGSIAIRTSTRGQVQAFTTVELDGFDPEGGFRIYNTRRIRRLSAVHEIAHVVDAVRSVGAHAERWIPKAGIDGRTFDVRVVVIGGRACHTVVRLSRTPMTNLHLLNDRSDDARVRERCGPESWRRAMESCEAAMRAFPGTRHAGVDLLIAPDFRRHAILEVNAFGDLLPGAMWQGMDTYDAELAAICGAGPFAARQPAEVA